MSVVEWVWSLILVIIGFSVIIFVHELGHFITARMVGVRIDVFALGFGPRLFGINRGGTDFCVRAIPLGGYVKMLGQEDFAVDQEQVAETQHDPASFLAKTPGQRLLVMSGGVVMNVVFAAVAFIIVFMHGWQTIAAVVGVVQPESPAAKAGLLAGDRFVRINGAEVRSFNEVKLAIALSNPGNPVELELERGGKIISMKAIAMQGDATFRHIGVRPAMSLKVADPGLPISGMPALKEGDVILKVDGVVPEVFAQVEDAVTKGLGKPVELTVRRQEGDTPVQVTVYKRAMLMLKLPQATSQSVSGEVPEGSILGLVPRCKFVISPDEELQEGKNKPDPDRVQAGDVIIGVGNILDPTESEIVKYLLGKRGKWASLTVLRGTEQKQVELDVPGQTVEFGYLIGLIGVDEDHLVLAGLTGNTSKTISVPRGARITSCDGQPVQNWLELIECLKLSLGKKVQLGFAHDQIGSLDIPDSTSWQADIDYTADMLSPFMETVIKGKYPHQAIALGIRETWNVIKMVYVTIQRVAIDRSVGARELMGPISIIHTGQKLAERVSDNGIYQLLYYFALISANLAVVNFLPIPIVDGGGAVLILLEKVRGKALSIRAMAVWQAVGLALIIGLFVFVTFNDIRRIVTGY